MVTRRLAIGIIALVALAAGAWFFLAGSTDRSPVVEPHSLAGLQNEFNRAAGSVRVILLLSPT